MTYRVPARRGPERVASYVTGSRAPAIFAVLAIGLGALAVYLRNPSVIDAPAPVSITAASLVCLFLALYTLLASVVKVSVDYDDETGAISVERSTGLRRTVETFARDEVREVSSARVVLLDNRVVPLRLEDEQVERISRMI